MKPLYLYLEEKFTIFSLLFFTGTLEFKSLYVASEGIEESSYLDQSTPLDTFLSLIQHGIFLITVLLLISRCKTTLQTLSRNKPLVMLMIVFLLSFLWSDFPELSLRRSLSLLETSLFGTYFASQYTVKKQLNLLALSFGFAIVINIVFTLLFPHFGIEQGVHTGAWRGTLEHKNFLGRLMVLSTLIFKTIVPKTKAELFFVMISFIASLLLILLSLSKTAIISIFCFVFLLIPIYQSFKWNFIIATLFQTISLLIIASSVTVFFSNLDNIPKDLQIDLTFTGRTDIWSATIHKLQENLWLGYGYQGFWYGDKGPSADVLKFMGPDAYAPHSHNGFIELAVASGLVGMTLFMISFFITLRRVLILANRTKNTSGLWPLIYLSFILISNQTELTLVQHNSIFWVIYVSISLCKLLPNPDNHKIYNLHNNFPKITKKTYFNS